MEGRRRLVLDALLEFLKGIRMELEILAKAFHLGFYMLHS